VIGVGRLGREHARVYASLQDIVSLSLYDRDAERARAVAVGLRARPCPSIETLLGECDVVSVCTPATNHREAAIEAFARGVHVLVEKPIASDSASARDMIAASAERRCVLQVGHIERFNGAFEAARALLRRPRFIESHRLATFSPRGIDVSVVHDLMIHDIDLILSVLKGSAVADLRASGAGVLTGAPDIVNARIEFEGGCVANVTASRISREPLRKIRFFEESRYVSADLREKSVEAYEKVGNLEPGEAPVDPALLIRRIPVEVDRSEPLGKEIAAFVDAATGRGAPAVTGGEGLDALVVAERIVESVAKNRRLR
jgi:predicted dehydrogenase